MALLTLDIQKLNKEIELMALEPAMRPSQKRRYALLSGEEGEDFSTSTPAKRRNVDISKGPPTGKSRG